MTYGTMELIQTVTVGSGGAASIDFTNIPATYDDLRILVSSRTNSTSSVWHDATVRFNGSTTGFSARLLYGTGTAAASNTNANDNLWTSSNSSTASTFGNAEIYIPNYRGSTNKSFMVDSVSENNGTAAIQALNALLWSNTAAITQVTITPATSNTFMQHSTATLYGITRVPAGAKATGGVITDDASYWYHTFTSSGAFTSTESLTADILVVAGGGGGALGGGSGGGGGGFRTANLSIPSGIAQTVVVGAGGGPGSYNATAGSNSIFGNITSTGGGGGNAYSGNPGQSGGSGGGGAADNGISRLGGAGNTPATTPSQGNNGGNNNVSTTIGQRHGGGGGGAGQSGANGTAAGGGKGGDGVASSLGGTSVFYAGGGGAGADRSNSATGGAGGLGGGGAGANGSSAQIAGTSGTANTGGGGGGGNATTSGTEGAGSNGGSGIVIVRYAK